MLHSIILTENEFNQLLKGKKHLIQRDKSFVVGEEIIITKTGTKEQMRFSIISVENEKMFKGWCVLGISKSGQESKISALDTAKLGVPLEEFKPEHL